MSRKIQISTHTIPTAGKKMTIELPIGHKYGCISIHHPNITAAQGTSIEVKINGKPFQQFEDLQQIQDMNTHYNRPQQADWTDIWFERPELADSEDRLICGIGTADIRTLSIDMVVAAGAVNPETGFEVHAQVYANELLGLVTSIVSEGVPVTAAGSKVVPKMPQAANIAAYWIKKATQNITNVRLQRDAGGVVNDVIDSTKEYLENMQKAQSKPRVPVTAKYTVIDFIERGLLEDSLQGQLLQGASGAMPVNAIKGTFELGTAEDLTIITESIGEFRA